MATRVGTTVYCNNTGELIDLSDVKYNNEVTKIIGGGGNDILKGNSLDNVIQGGYGDDQIWGGPGGNNTLSGGPGTNVFWWDKNGGHDTILDEGERHKGNFLCLYNMSRQECEVSNENGNLHIAAGRAQLDIRNWYHQEPKHRIQIFIFNDNTAYLWNDGKGARLDLFSECYKPIYDVLGTVIHIKTLDSGNCIIHGNYADNIIEGGNGNDQIWGGPGGNNILSGGAGADVYWWGMIGGDSDAHDIILDGGEKNKGDVLYLYDVSRQDYFASNVDGDLHISAGNAVLDIKNWYHQNPENRIQTFICNDNIAYVWNDGHDAEINLFEESFQWLTNRWVSICHIKTLESGNCILRGDSFDNIIEGGSGNDQIWGGSGGSNILSGGGGANVFWWGNGEGNDIITDLTSSDLVKLYNISMEDCSASRLENDLIITSNLAGNSLTIKAYFSNESFDYSQNPKVPAFYDSTKKLFTLCGDTMQFVMLSTPIQSQGIDLEILNRDILADDCVRRLKGDGHHAPVQSLGAAKQRSL
ncbi:calcium-binding protein [Pelosinus baikalensis]|uniref:Uncharacterized protein n=1 Tax=Pelosinus baikalensis TaxID=2892015 RepID=A0ABS8HTM5_9FIRM|nr:calcium-binding protein [Pelosinus baikalensis]MCC5466515.1 hypothetical protein [Pelosinus baikalensis]